MDQTLDVSQNSYIIVSGTVHCTPQPPQTQRSNLPDLAHNRSKSTEVEFFADFCLSYGTVLSNIMLDKVDYFKKFRIPDEAYD